MKRKTITLLLTLLLIFSVSMAVSAAPSQSGETAGISQSENAVMDMSAVQGEAPDGPQARDGAENAEEEAQTAPRKNNNTPFFIGAGIAVLMFAGVAVYCKTNGNKTY